MGEKTIGLALLGAGIVGGGVVKILRDQRELLRQRTGMTFDIRHVVVRDPKKSRDLGNLPISSDARAAIDDPKVDMVVELIGGTGAAGEYVEYAISKGKNVVTANKSLLAAKGPELFSTAQKNGACIAFEASCGGGIPIIEAILRSLIGNRIDALIGIVNGTCNFILTKMTHNGWSYDEALKQAQKEGFAEADPTLDVSGRDAAQKLAVLANLAFNARIAEKDLHVEGIDQLQDTDIKFASEMGYVIKLLAIAERVAGDKLALRVHPTLVHKTDVLADVSGSFNAVSVYGSALGHALFYGRGAGQLPTASAVVADIVNVAMGVTPLAFKQLGVFSTTANRAANVLSINELQSRYYLRLMAMDVPGVMAQITRILGDNGISLSAILQHEANANQVVSIVITTHMANEGSIRKSLKQLDALKDIKAPTVCLRVIDQPKEFAGN